MQGLQFNPTLAPPRRPIQALSLASLLIIAFVCTAVPVSSATSSTYIEFGLFLGIAATLLLAIASARVIGATDYINIRNVFVDVAIPRNQVAEIETLNGLEIVTLDGKRYNSSAYGQSVLQILFLSRSVESAGNRIERWLAETQGKSGELTQVRVRLRRWWYVGLPISVALALTYELTLFALTPAIRPYFL